MELSGEKKQALNDFFVEVERRAYRTAQLAVGNRDDALDIVQEAMCKLTEKYGQRPPEEWGALFHRILHSRIYDHYRRNSVRNRVISWFNFLPGRSSGSQESSLQMGVASEGSSVDLIQTAEDRQSPGPARQLRADLAAEAIFDAVQQLPLRQQQAFLLRAWEGLNVAATAEAMQCSEGSVKTHYSRAMQNLRDKLREHYD